MRSVGSYWFVHVHQQYPFSLQLPEDTFAGSEQQCEQKTHYGKGFPSLTPPDLKWANAMKRKVLDCSTSSHLQHNNPRHRYSTGSNSWLPAAAFTAHARRQHSLKKIRRWQGERQQCSSASCCLGIPLDKKWNATVRCCVCLCMCSVSFLSKCCVFFVFFFCSCVNTNEEKRHPSSLFSPLWQNISPASEIQLWKRSRAT